MAMTYKTQALRVNKNLICKMLRTPRNPLYIVTDHVTGEQLTDGHYSANSAWLHALQILARDNKDIVIIV